MSLQERNTETIAATDYLPVWCFVAVQPYGGYIDTLQALMEIYLIGEVCFMPFADFT